MTARNDSSTIVTQPLANGVINGADGLTFIMPTMGMQALSVTVQPLTGSTAVGSLAIQCTDLIRDWTGPLDPTVGWAPMNYPNSSTPVTVAVASGTASVNVQVNGLGCKAIRLVYTATSGSGNANIGVTCRANSRT